MKVIITGGGGFLGNQLARKLVERGSLIGPSGESETIDSLVLFDKFIADERKEGLEGHAEFIVGDMSDEAAVSGLIDRDDVSVFHLASMVSGECEVQFDEALAANLDGARYLLEALRKRNGTPKIVFASSVAAFGGASMGDTVSDVAKRCPQTTYGVTKVITELLINDYSRKGFIDGRGARLPTVIIRPGKPNAAASSFCSGMFREPLAGKTCELPVDRSARMPVIGYRTVVECFVQLHEIPAEKLDDDRTFCLPSHDLSVTEMVETLAATATKLGIALGPIVDAPDPVIEKIVATWPTAIDANRALALGLPDVESLEAMIEGYVADFG